MPADPVSLLQHLVRIPSVNPDDNPGTDRVGEAELARFLAGWLEALGAEVVLEEVRPERPNLIARFAPRDGRPRILLGPHLDTVGVGGMVIEPFGGDIRDGRLWGRGACDTKGPMAAMLWGLREQRERLADLPVAVDFVAFMGEESGQWGSKDFVRRHGADYAFAVVGEPTSMQVVNRNKGSFQAVVRATGKAAHSATPELGENAILKLVEALGALDHHLKRALGGYGHPVLGPSTLNIGVIRGGSRPNIVPDLAEAELDIRVTPDLAAAGGAHKLLRDIIDDYALPVELISSSESPPMETPGGHPVVLALLATAPDTALVGAPWFSDACHLAAGGVPGICIGPGSIRQAHTVDEFIEVTEVERGAAFFSAFIRGLADRGLPFPGAA
ncbi:MAG: M20 family metallopeptidase [Akkermansiaceae bacterium]|jgi:acetylornithine deacetylase|nr:M20 family metallopeptidase [Akkermansiaceae bacterium]